MSENPIEAICNTIARISVSVQTNVFNLITNFKKPANSQVSISPSSMLAANSLLPQHTGSHTLQSGPVTKEELGRATWTFIHTLGAQYPEKPTRQQKKDVKELMSILSQMYPCKECADHFKEVLSDVVVYMAATSAKKTCLPYGSIKDALAFLSINSTVFGRSNPVQAGSQAEFSNWLCRVHNVVNRSLGKPIFQCERVDARWGKLDCEHRVCDLQGSVTFWWSN